MAALLLTVGVVLGGCAAEQLRKEAAADAITAAKSWDDPAVQERWARALIGRPPLIEASIDGATSAMLATLNGRSVESTPGIGDGPGHGVVHYATGSDQYIETLDAASTLRTALDSLPNDPCEDDGSCGTVLVTGATATQVTVATARGMATVPAWSLTIEGLFRPLVLSSAVVTAAGDVAPEPNAPSSSWLLSRRGSTLWVSLFVPDCQDEYQQHLHETDTAIVVWATAAPSDKTCVTPVHAKVTFTLEAPIGDRPVIDPAGRLLLPPPAWAGL